MHPSAALVNETEDCPDCGGTRLCYPKGFEGGAAKCKLVDLRKGLPLINEKNESLHLKV